MAAAAPVAAVDVVRRRRRPPRESERPRESEAGLWGPPPRHSGMAHCLLLWTLPAAAALSASTPRAAAPPPVPAPFAGPGIGLAPIFTDHAVLQRAPAVSAVYGVVVGDSHATGVEVTVVAQDVSLWGGSGLSYTVEAEHVERVNASYFRWKAALHPTAAGTGSYSIRAACVGCLTSSIGSANITDVVYGDVFVCAGRK
jgi:hypothetical protein